MDEFDNFSIWDNDNKMGTNWGSSVGTSAYILVYEKKLKSDVTLEFNNDTITEKDRIIQNFVLEDEHKNIKEESTEGITKVTVPFYGIKPFVPRELESEISNDNFKFLMEQHVYSREFLTFICKVSSFSQLGDFNPRTLPKRMIENKIPSRLKDLLCKVYRLQMNLFMNVLSRATDNDVGRLDPVHRPIHQQPDANHIAVSRTHERMDPRRPLPEGRQALRAARQLLGQLCEEKRWRTHRAYAAGSCQLLRH